VRSRWLRLILVSLLVAGASGRGAAAVLKLGSRGPSVGAVQGYLKSLSLLAGPADGVYGSATRAAVTSFQRREGLTADGVVGPATLSRLQSAATGAPRTIVYRVSRGDTVYGIARRYGTSPEKVVALNGLTQPRRLQPGQTLRVPSGREAEEKSPGRAAGRPGEVPGAPGGGGAEVIPWSQVNTLFPNGAEARVIAVQSGIAFRVRRIQGTNHADCEPVTFADTAAVKAAFGGSWSWDRLPIVVEVAGRRIAASMNGYPHGTGHPSRNGLRGHFCLHFYGSRTHGSQVVDPEHHAAILLAARKTASEIPAAGTGAPVAAPGAEALRTED
jgi:peptidoglycan hydrolase-like protein with peptidoglycan-binding domain